MLLAYLDEFGHIGPYMADDHKKFFHHPVFGYAGFVLPAEKVRRFGSTFEFRKERQFRAEIVASKAHPRRWEKKGAEIMTTGSFQRYPQNIDAMADLSGYLRSLGGDVFYYGQVKPIGTEKMTGESARERNSHALRQAVLRLCRYADQRGENLMVFLDSVNAKPRLDAVTDMAKFIYSSPDAAMKRVVEVPMQLESHLYGTTQFADWLCAVVTRATHFHFAQTSDFSWAPAVFEKVCGQQTAGESRIWVKESSTAVTSRALSDPRPWHAMKQRTMPSTRSLPANSIGAANPGLAALRDSLKVNSS